LAEFRAELEQHHGALTGARQFVRILQLLTDHPLTRVCQAVEACRREQLISAEAVIQRVRSLAASESQTCDSRFWTAELTTVPQVHIPLPDLTHFDHLLGDAADRRGPRDDELSAAAEAGCESQVRVLFA
jgi:hypothetical protein